MTTRIVVPLDGSAVAERALPVATELAGLLRVPVTLLHVVDLNHLDHYGLETVAGRPGLAEQLASAEAVAVAWLRPHAEAIEGRGIATTLTVRPGDPADAIVEESVADDLVVMSSHGRGGAARWFLGSVAEAVARRSRGPVMLIRAEDGASQPDESRRAEGEFDRLLHQDHYRAEELARLVGVDPAVVRQAALSGRLAATIVDHHIITITRADAVRWLADR